MEKKNMSNNQYYGYSPPIADSLRIGKSSCLQAHLLGSSPFMSSDKKFHLTCACPPVSVIFINCNTRAASSASNNSCESWLQKKIKKLIYGRNSTKMGTKQTNSIAHLQPTVCLILRMAAIMWTIHAICPSMTESSATSPGAGNLDLACLSIEFESLLENNNS
jgi:hypothetical protein